MAKGSGTTRASGSRAANGISNRMTTPSGVNMRYSNNNKNAWDEIEERLGVRFVAPLTDREAQLYKEVSGVDLPQDAVRIIFGRGAANGSTFEDTLNTPMYNNIKVIEAAVPFYRGELNPDAKTYVSGYESEAQLKSFLKDVEQGTIRNRYERLQRRWNHR